MTFPVHCGGGAVSAAVEMARRGLETSRLVKLGRDSRADVILSTLAVVLGANLRDPADREPPDLSQEGFDANGSIVTLAHVFDSLISLGPRWVIVTDGKDGA